MTEPAKPSLRLTCVQVAGAVIVQNAQHPFGSNSNRLYFQPCTCCCILEDIVHVRRFFQFHPQDGCEYKNGTAYLKRMIIKEKALTYHAVHKKQTYAMSIGVRAVVWVSNIFYKRKYGWLIERNCKKKTKRNNILNMFFNNARLFKPGEKILSFPHSMLILVLGLFPISFTWYVGTKRKKILSCKKFPWYLIKQCPVYPIKLIFSRH